MDGECPASGNARGKIERRIGTMRTRVFLADDHRLLLEAFRNLLEPRYEVLGTASDGREMVSKASSLEIDLVLLDIAMPNLNGFDAAIKLRKILPDVKIIFLTMKEDTDLVTEAFRIGANGYILKNSAPEDFFEAIDQVLGGGSYVSPGLSGDMIASFIKDPQGDAEPARPTTRQREVLQLLAEGKTMKEVATILCITPRTVAFHKYQMMENLNLKSNSELIQYAFRVGVAN